MLDGKGDVIGILVASAVDDKGVALEGQEFVVPISVITEKLNQSNIKPRTSPITTAYDEALANFYKGYYKRALPQFQHVKNLYGAHPYVSKYISDTLAAIDAGKDKTPRPIWLWLMIGGGAVLVLLLALTAWLVLRRRGRRGPASTPAPQYAFAGYPGQQPGQPGQYPQQPPYQGPPQYQPGYPQQPGYPPQYPPQHGQQPPPGYQPAPGPYPPQPAPQPPPPPAPAPPPAQPDGDGQTPPPPPW